MKKNYFLISAILVIVIIGGVFIYTSSHKEKERTEVKKPEKTFTATLYYLDSGGRFKEIKAELSWYYLIEDRIKEVIKALKVPPDDLISAIPSDAEVLDVFFKGRIAYIDFSKEFVTEHPGGTRGEMETVYSIVNSVVSTFEEVKGVKFLVNGEEIETIKGHIYLGNPVEKDLRVLNE